MRQLEENMENKRMLDYEKIAKHYEKCFEINGDTCKGVDWPRQSEAENRYKVMLNVIDWYKMKYQKNDIYDVLDLGCGLGHLYEYIRKHRMNIRYSGLDISDVFIRKCKSKFSEVEFICKDILKESDLKTYDFIIMNGVFTEKLDLSYEDMWSFFVKMVEKAYSFCDKGIAFNLMSKDVDWGRDDLFHVSLSRISSWLTGNLTRNFVIRYDYGLYEYTVYVMKESL